MGVTMTICIAFWLASSFIEYKLIKTFPAARRWIQHPVGGIALSLLIGFGVSFFVGSVGGVGVFLGQLLGLATNSFTFKLYSTLEQLNKAFKETMVQIKQAWHENIDAVRSAWHTLVSLFRGIFKAIHAVLWVLSTPMRIANKLSGGQASKTI